jgi:LuxR family maltose regulon positive regulatory protein
MLTALERGNLFHVPLDDIPRWRCFHHLFADSLQPRLKAQQPDQAAVLYLRASDWFEQNGMPSGVIRRTIADGEF